MERRRQVGVVVPARSSSPFFFLLIALCTLISCCAGLSSNNNNNNNNNINNIRYISENEVVVEVDEFVYSKRGEVYNSLLGADDASKNCGTHVAVDGSKFDLSSLTTKDGYNATSGQITFYWNFCSPVTGSSLVPSPMCASNPTAYAYLVNGTGANMKCFDIGDTSSQPVLSDGVNGPGSGVQIAYRTASGFFTIVRVNCNANINYVSFRNAQTFPNNATFIITVQANNGCKLKPTSQKGLSGGSIFLIVFFVGLTTYFLLGSLIKWKLMGAPVGADMIPNVEFWTQLPGYILDGCRFTKGKLMGMCGGGYNSI